MRVADPAGEGDRAGVAHLGSEIGARADQRRDDRAVALADRLVQGGEAGAVPAIDGDPRGDQGAHHAGVAARDRDVEGLRARACRQQQLDRGGTPVRGGELEQRPAFVAANVGSAPAVQVPAQAGDVPGDGVEAGVEGEFCRSEVELFTERSIASFA